MELFLTAQLIPAKPDLPQLTMGLMGTFTASMGETLVGLLAPAPVLLVTLGLVGLAVKALCIM